MYLYYSDEEYVNEIKSLNDHRTKKFFIVNEKWILESWNARVCMDEQLFKF